MSAETPYNPLDKKNLGASIGDALLARDVHPLGGLSPFDGAGIYAIYYAGSFPAYAAIARENREGRYAWPIYVGKAIPAGARKGGIGLDEKPGRVLFQRLKEHAKSIDAVANLDIQDFGCRFLVVDDIWIPLGESLLIAKSAPIWNTLIDGFGNRDPGGGRHAGLRPRWDVLHPGRAWARKYKERPETADQIAGEVSNYLRGAAIPAGIFPRAND